MKSSDNNDDNDDDDDDEDEVLYDSAGHTHFISLAIKMLMAISVMPAHLQSPSRSSEGSH